MNKKDEINLCKYCLFGVKHYYTLGNRIFFEKVSECMRPILRRQEEKQSFKERSNCLFFEKSKIPLPENDIEEKLFFMSMQIDEIMDTLSEIYLKLKDVEDYAVDSLQEQLADKTT